MLPIKDRLKLTIILRKFSYEQIEYNTVKECFKMIGYNIDDIEFKTFDDWLPVLKNESLNRRDNPKYEDIKKFIISDVNNNKYEFMNDIENVRILAENNESVSKRVLSEYNKIKSMKK